MAASRRHSCGSLVGSEPLHSCCITSSFRMGKGMTLDVKSLVVARQPNLVNSSRAYLQLSGTGGNRSLNLGVEIPRHVRIPKSQCILAASLFFGMLMSHSVHYETTDGTEDEVEEEVPTRWDAVIAVGPSDSSRFSVSVITDYLEIRYIANGMSLFRSIVYCSSTVRLRFQSLTSLRLSRLFRKKVVEALDRRRSSVECFIEGDFDEYVKRMASEETVGSEVEISMAAHVKRTPIRVYRKDKGRGGLVLIAEYGSSYIGTALTILYKGASPSDGPFSPSHSFDVPDR